MSATSPPQGFEESEDAQGHKFLTDPGEVPTEGGRGQLPMPGDGDEDDTSGHAARLVRAATDGGDQDDTDDPYARA